MSDEYDMPELHFNPGERNADTMSQPHTSHDRDQNRAKQSASVIRIVMIVIALVLAALVIFGTGFGIGFGTGFSAGQSADSEEWAARVSAESEECAARVSAESKECAARVSAESEECAARVSAESEECDARVSAEREECTCPNMATPEATTHDVSTVEMDDPDEVCFTENEVNDIRKGKDCAEAKIYETPINTWITFQRRGAFDQDFYRPFYREYEDGFGNICSGGDFWLGLRHLWNLTSQGVWQMRSEVTDFNTDEIYWIEYENFVVGEGPGYTLGLGGAYSGNIAGEIGAATTNGWGRHRGMKFTTYDKDQDTYSGNCANGYQPGGFWYKACYTVGVNQRQPMSDGGVAGGCHTNDRMIYYVCNPSCGLKTLRASLLQIRRVG